MAKKKNEKYTLRKAVITDVKVIQMLINDYAKKKLLLPRSLSFIYDNIRDFVICENSKKTVVGCCAVHIVWENLAEIKSLVVKKTYQKQGIGRLLVEHCLKEAKELGVTKVFALTFEAAFFMNLKFMRVSKNRLPEKVWRECIDCHMFPDCDEIAVMRQL